MDVVWLKRDVRLVDSAPLWEAATGGRPFRLLFMYEPDQLAHESVHGSHLAFVAEGLEDVEQRLRAVTREPAGGRRFVTVRRGEATEVLASLHAEAPLGRLLSHQETGHGASFARDRRVARWCRAAGVRWVQLPQSGVVRGLGRGGGDWQAAWRAHLESHLQEDALPSPFDLDRGAALGRLRRPFAGEPGPPAVGELGLPGAQAGDRPGRQRGGESLALGVLASFLEGRGEKYSGGISSPNSSWTACSRLSPYLAWGHISLRTVWQNVEARRQAAQGKWKRSLDAFLVRTQWRCSYVQRFEMRCWMEHRWLCQAWEDLRQGRSVMYGDAAALNGTTEEERLAAFEQGRTGYPMVDACMRCLLETGWLNFRMRCMLVSFAVYNLWLDWRAVAAHMARCFLDYEPGIHYPQLQMQAGTTGVDLRCYSATKQAKEQDPQAEFVRKYVPELRAAPSPAAALEPWRRDAAAALAGCGYPPRIVDEARTARVSKAVVSALQRWWQEGALAPERPDVRGLGGPAREAAGRAAGGRKGPAAGGGAARGVMELLSRGGQAQAPGRAISDPPSKPDAPRKALRAGGEPGRASGAPAPPEGAGAPWRCPRCTLLNAGAALCGACELPRGAPGSPPAHEVVVIDLD